VPEFDPSGRETFLRHFPVSCETLEKFDHYAELLSGWNAKFNLIGESTLPDIWRRHFLDSAQLVKFIPGSAKTLVDLGSGAGFPGLVLSIMNFSEIHLVESIGKKVGFLRAVIAELKLNATVRQMRIESIHGIKFDVLTARALKPLPHLLKLAKPLMNKDSICLLLKGQRANAELTESAEYWKFDCEMFPSISGSSGRVLKISNLASKAGSGKNGAQRKIR